jgi:glycerol-3-phosphate dehydrogenase
MIMENASVRTASPTVDNLVIGGGLAGSMVAILHILR